MLHKNEKAALLNVIIYFRKRKTYEAPQYINQYLLICILGLSNILLISFPFHISRRIGHTKTIFMFLPLYLKVSKFFGVGLPVQ